MADFKSNVQHLPSSVTSIEFTGDFNSKIKLPPSLTHLTFSCQYNQPLKFPPFLKVLKGGIQGDSLKKLPDSIEDIKVYDCTDPSKHCIPTSVRKLKIGKNFKLPLATLPPFLTHLIFSGDLDDTLLHNLPSILTHLTIRYGGFNQPIDSLPSTLTHLTFIESSAFNQPVDHLPSTLTHLTFGNSFNQPVNNLPSSLKYIKFGAVFKTPWKNPPPITHLALYYFYDDSDIFNLQFPPSITHFAYGTSTDYEPDPAPDFQCNPPELEYFHLSIENTTCLRHKLHSQKLKKATYEIFENDYSFIKLKVKINFETKEIDLSTILFLF